MSPVYELLVTRLSSWIILLNHEHLRCVTEAKNKKSDMLFSSDRFLCASSSMIQVTQVKLTLDEKNSLTKIR